MTKTVFTLPGAESLTRSRAAEIVQAASRFEAHLMIELGQRIVNAKSVLGLLSLSNSEKREAALVADGPDEEEASRTLLAMLAGEAQP